MGERTAVGWVVVEDNHPFTRSNTASLMVDQHLHVAPLT